MSNRELVLPGIKFKVLKRAKKICQAKLNKCLGMATEVHHIKARKYGGGHEMDNLMAVCRRCHDRITYQELGTEKFRSDPV